MSALSPWTRTQANTADIIPMRLKVVFQKLLACASVDPFIHTLIHLPYYAFDRTGRTRFLAAGTVTALGSHRHSALKRGIAENSCEPLHGTTIRSNKTATFAYPAKSCQMCSRPVAENAAHADEEPMGLGLRLWRGGHRISCGKRKPGDWLPSPVLRVRKPRLLSSVMVGLDPTIHAHPGL